MEIRKLLAKNVRMYRKRREYKQEELAEKCGLICQDSALANQAYISDIENEKRNITIDNLGTLAKALEIEPYELFSTKEQSERV